MPSNLTLPPPRSPKQLAAFLFRHPRVMIVSPWGTFDARYRRFARRGTCVVILFAMRGTTPGSPPRETAVPVLGTYGVGLEIGLTWRDERLVIERGCNDESGRVIHEIFYRG